MRTCSCFRVTTLLLLLSLALTAVGWSAYNVTENVVCKFFPLTLSGVCDDSHSLVLRAITLGRSANFSCATATILKLRNSSVRDECCRHRPEDTYVTYHLPSERGSLTSPYKELADKCFQTPDHCDLYGIPNITTGQVPEGVIPNQGPLSYVAVSYSCIPSDTVLSFNGNGNLTAPVVSLRQDERTPASSQCLIYGGCDVTIELGIIDVNVNDPCTLTMNVNDTFPCNSSLQLPLSSSSNFLAVSLNFTPSSGHKQVVWVEAKGSDESPITVACGTSAPALKSVLCTTTTSTTTTTTTTTPTTTTVATTTPTTTTTNSPITSSQGTSAKTSSVAPSGTASPATQDTLIVGLAVGFGEAVLVAVILLVVFLCKKKSNRVEVEPGSASNPAPHAADTTSRSPSSASTRTQGTPLASAEPTSDSTPPA